MSRQELLEQALEAHAGVLAARGLRLAGLVLDGELEVARYYAKETLMFANLSSSEVIESGVSVSDVKRCMDEAMRELTIREHNKFGKPPKSRRRGQSLMPVRDVLP